MLRVNMIAMAHLSHWAAGRMVSKGRGIIIMATAPIMPRSLDLAFMGLLFRGKRITSHD